MSYQSKFHNWDSRASVRVKPRREMAPQNSMPMFFPPELVPALTSTHVRTRGTETAHRILVHSLHHYLHFTTVLEQTAVLPVTARISLGESGVALPAEMVADAFKITTDEAWHAQFSHEFSGAVARVTGITADAVVQPQFVTRLEFIRQSFEADLRNLVDLMFAVVSETLVSALLSEIPNDKRLPGPVRALIADHAADEGRHHAYFHSFLPFLWTQLTAHERRAIGPRIPELIHAFLDPDLDAVRAALRASGFSDTEVADIFEETYAPGSPIFDVWPAARGTVRGFRSVGALDDPATFDAFAAEGVLVNSRGHDLEGGEHAHH